MQLCRAFTVPVLYMGGAYQVHCGTVLKQVKQKKAEAQQLMAAQAAQVSEQFSQMMASHTAQLAWEQQLREKLERKIKTLEGDTWAGL